MRLPSGKGSQTGRRRSTFVRCKPLAKASPPRGERSPLHISCTRNQKSAVGRADLQRRAHACEAPLPSTASDLA